MGDVTTLEMIRGLYEYHRWANRRLFDVAIGLGDDVTARDLGKSFSFPTIKAMFTHIYGADFLWFQCWKAISPARRLRDGDFPTLAAVRAPWDEFEKEQAMFIDTLTPADLARTVEPRWRRLSACVVVGAPTRGQPRNPSPERDRHDDHDGQRLAPGDRSRGPLLPRPGISGLTMGMKERADDLTDRRRRARAMGGADAVAKQHASGKLTVRERIDLLFDSGSFTEIGVQATHAGVSPEMAGRETPADGVVTGFGRIDGRFASVIAYDFTVMAGSMGRTAEVKCNRAREVAYTK